MKQSPQSPIVVSSQTGIHPRLREWVGRHLRSRWRYPGHEATRQAFGRVCQIVARGPAGLVLDSGCGTGAGTRSIAARHPDDWILGIDQSEARLARTGADRFPSREGNIIWVRAELSGFWSLALKAGWRPKAHYLLYPNPWPKPGHVQRRWHGHPVFPTLLRLGGEITLRTNWRIYADEFAAAVDWATGFRVTVNPLVPDDISTPFEDKYRSSGHELWAVVTPDLAGRMAPQPSLSSSR